MTKQPGPDPGLHITTASHLIPGLCFQGPPPNLRLPGISFWAAHTLLQKLPPTLFLPKFSPGLSVLGLNPVPAGVTQPEYLRVDAGSKGRAHEWGVPTGVPGVGHSGESSTHEPQESLPFLTLSESPKTFLSALYSIWGQI